jgi:hypothetical protein
MSISTATMISYMRAMGVAVADVSDTDALIICNHVIGKYTAAKPIHVVVENFLTTVEDQPWYDVPDGTIGVDHVYWLKGDKDSWPSILSDLQGIYGDWPANVSSYEGATELDFLSPEQMVRWNALSEHWIKQHGGTWRVENTGTAGAMQVWLSPIPSSSGDVIPGTIWRARPVALIDSSLQSKFDEVALAYAKKRKFEDSITAGKVRLGDYSKESSTGGMSSILSDSNTVISDFNMWLAPDLIGDVG